MREFGFESRPDIEVEKMAQEVVEADPKISWATYMPDKQYGVVISFPHECSITGTLTYREDGTTDLYIDIFKVNDRLQGRGIGTRLMEALIREGIAYGVDTISGHVTSKSALKTRAKVFGVDNLHFYKPRTNEAANITYDEALREEKVDFTISSSLDRFKQKRE